MNWTNNACNTERDATTHVLFDDDILVLDLLEAQFELVDLFGV